MKDKSVKSQKCVAIDREVSRVLLAVLEELGTPVALSMKILIENGEWVQVVNKSTPDPFDYLDTSLGGLKYARDAQAVALLQKCKNLPVEVDKETPAVEKWLKAEAICCSVNVRFERYFGNGSSTPTEVRMLNFLEDARENIARVLGNTPKTLDGKFGPGSSTEIRGRMPTLFKTAGGKMTKQPHMTADCQLYWQALYGKSVWSRALAMYSPYSSADLIRRDAVLGFAPKKATIHRTTETGPGVNVFLQLAAGSFIRNRLKKIAGIDLDEGQALHARDACAASLDGGASTIDLSSASDTISYWLVKYLLPEGWFSLLDDLRTRFTRVPARFSKVLGLEGTGKPATDIHVKLEKFSSMGNGFTFELETLIFWALSKAAVDRKLGRDTKIRVYGDDIIVPTTTARDVLAILRFAGFTPNEEKTYVTGPFRESCGGDFFLGQSVRPFYLKELPREPSDWIGLANGLWAARNFGRTRFVSYLRARRIAFGNTPSHIRNCIGPEALGDLLFHDVETKWRSRTHWSRRYFRTIKPFFNKVKLTEYNPGVQLALALYGSPDYDETIVVRPNITGILSGCGTRLQSGWDYSWKASEPTLTPRGDAKGYRVGWTVYS